MVENTPTPEMLAKADRAAEKARSKALRPWYKKKRFVIPLAFVALIVVSNIANSGESPDLKTDTSSIAEDASSPEASKVPPAPTVTAQTLTGSGDDVLSVSITDPAVITFSCPGCAHNVVLKTDGSDSLLVNEIGAYSGQHLVNARKGSMITTLTINADSDWTVDIADLSTIPVTSGAASGHGDTVINFGSKFKAAAVTNVGEHNFVVYGYGGSYPELAVNEIGSYQGTVELTGPGFVQVESAGDWTITPK